MATSTLLPPFASLQRTLRRSQARLRLLVVCALPLLAFVFLRARGEAGSSREPEAWLASWLGGRGLELRPGQIVWLGDQAGPFSWRPLLLAAHRAGEPDDVYYAELRTSEAGAPLDGWWLTNVTRSSGAAEGDLVAVGRYVAFTVRIGDQTDAISVLDTRGEPTELTRGWPGYARAQNAVTNVQETGRAHGFGRRYYRLLEPTRSMSLGRDGDRFVASSESMRVVIDPRRLEPVVGANEVRAQQQEKGRPGTITWLVDTVRNVPWIGPEPVAWLEHAVFGVSDRVTRAYHSLVREDAGEGMRDALSVPQDVARKPAPEKEAPKASEPTPALLLTAPDPELAWPPPKLARQLPGRVRGEGEWIPVAGDPFVNGYPNAPSAFYQTFIRVDPERPYVSVYITLWDPRQVKLHVAMGTQEPESATGETGDGEIPRDPDTLRHLVAAFNGGFQAMHGEFGMMAEGTVYLPPKPYAATVAVYDDGRVGMGSWPGPGRGGWDEESANAQIPHDMIAMRQNLTSVVEGSVYNPWERWWWGAAPTFAQEQTYIARSGLCLTAEGFMAYLWGESMGPEELGKAMLALRCARGMHLDMNTKHTGFEFYRPHAPSDPALPSLGRPLVAETEAEGPIERGLGFAFRSRLAVKTMSPLRFPRYIQRDPRDFFFLTLKPVLPGAELSLGGKSIAFSTAGTPNAGWPAAFARAYVGDQDAAGTWIVRVDLARAVPAALAPPELDRPLSHLTGLAKGSGEGPLALYATRVHGSLAYRVGPPPPDAIVVLRGAQLPRDGAALRAAGLDREGFLLYAEAGSEDQARSLGARLREAGVEHPIALPDESRLALDVDGQPVSVDGRHVLSSHEGLAFMAETRPAAQVIFGDVKPRPYYRWGGLQGQRVRYFPTGAPRFRAPEEALAPVGHGRPADAGVQPQTVP